MFRMRLLMQNSKKRDKSQGPVFKTACHDSVQTSSVNTELVKCSIFYYSKEILYAQAQKVTVITRAVSGLASQHLHAAVTQPSAALQTLSSAKTVSASTS